ncbi:hypothetical protein K435DRAFT_776308 [Dendrothele bispora CBS 962.96]|uniref:G-patch domain-containing protein n=1 Tax=Dendrothele bispora (strain CBS 962.96) TaxID=1314807 RepID=A0A4S8MEP0_DENBC|nr:hypothetical protein K435DRAFT_776308 [Dendrothele bispora CBS 962.96]
MATRAYTIYSHYDPEDREALEKETHQTVDSTEDNAEAWEVEVRAAYKRKVAAPPRFVPASTTFGDLSSPDASSSKRTLDAPARPEDGVADWYRSLTSRSTTPTTGSAAANRHPSSTAVPAPSSIPQNVYKPTPSFKETKKLDKNNWFIQNVVNTLESDTDTQLPSTPSSTLADILALDPPPLPSEQQFRPPVFLAIGPANKGFAMLQNSGWSEGEALGPDVIRRNKQLDTLDFDLESGSREPKRKRTVKHEEVEMSTEDADVKEIRQVSVIDLTLSDDEADSGGGVLHENGHWDGDDEGDVTEVSVPDENTSRHGRKALITPLATVLKSDRLGIGLKAKTEGPYKSSMKRVTRNAAALTAHLQNAADTRKRKQQYGRGQRGISREYKQEQMKRQGMLAYFNS